MEATDRVVLCDTKRQYLNFADKINEAMQRVLTRGWYVMGPEHEAFEREFAEYCGRQFAIACGNGTDALELALRVAGVGPGDEVITVANAGGFTTTVCLILGATPVYVDVDAQLSMNPASLAQAIGPRTRAIVVTHLYGWMAEMPEILRLAAERGLAVIEDCAQAHGAERNGRRAGSFAQMGTFSFYPTKNLGAIGDGGAIVTDDPELAGRLRRLRQYGWQEKYQATLSGGRNSRLDELQSAILRVKLPSLDHWNAQRRQIAARYAEAAHGTALRLVHEPSNHYVAHLAIGRHPDRDGFRKRLSAAGIDTAVHYPILDHQQVSLRQQPWRAVDLSVTETASREILTFPCYAEMREDEVERVCSAIRVAA